MLNLKKMVIKKYGAPILASFFATVSCFVVMCSPTHAASDYDDSYHLIPNLTLQQDSSCLTSMPLTGSYYDTDYAKYILDENLWHPDDRNSSSEMYAARESFRTALTDENGTWGVSRQQNYNGQGIEGISVYWSTNPSAYLRWYPEMVGAYDFSSVLIRCHRYNYWGYKYNGYFGGSVWNPNVVAAVATLPTDIRPVQNLFVHSNNPSFNYNYPSDYEGEMIPDGQVDADNDGLNFAKEIIQGTSDTNADTDSDGISDLKESRWFENRDDVFCGLSQCAYPDPLKKDLYVEIDWMKDGATEYKPTNTQLVYVADGLDDLDYNIHIDTGQYGGGNELSNYIQYLPFAYGSAPVGFFDLKNGNASESIAANFDPDREGIWRYMITGYGYDEEHSSSGASYAGSGNVFISLGRITDNQVGFGYSNVNTAIAGTMVHELGHSLCMSKAQRYSYQSAACRYAGVDSLVANTYNSVLNYNLQMFQLTLSDGSNGSGDHDDWDAINEGGIADFSSWNTDEADFEPGALHHGLTSEDAQEAIKSGTYGKVERDGKVYDLRENKVYDSKDGKVYNLDKNGNQAELSNNQSEWVEKMSSTVDDSGKKPDNITIPLLAVGTTLLLSVGGVAWYIKRRK